MKPIRNAVDDIRWAERTLKAWPRLEQRIAALGEQMYRGCGFHYALVREANGRRRQLEDIIAGKTIPPLTFVVRVCVECLFSDVARNERSAAGMAISRRK
jgi:hypothetical protein